MNMDERSQILREIDALAKDFESLRLADIDGVLWTQRRMRNAQPQWTDPNVPIQCLLERQNQDVRLVAGMSTYFDESDSPNGWYSTHISAATGGHSKKAFDAIQRAGLWIKRRSVLFAILAKELLSAKGVILGDSAWPDVVQLIAGRGDDATLKIPVWVVQVGVVEFTTDSDGKPYLIPSDKRLPATVTVATWNQRSQIPVVGWLAQITPADEAYIGDPPRMFHCEQKLDSFLRDSELALDWLRRWVEGFEIPSAIPKKDVSSLSSAQRFAYLAAAYAEAREGRQLTDREAWEYLKENGIEGAEGLDNYELPMRDTFADYMTQARGLLGEKRKTPRGGRKTRSVLRRSDSD